MVTRAPFPAITAVPAAAMRTSFKSALIVLVFVVRMFKPPVSQSWKLDALIRILAATLPVWTSTQFAVKPKIVTRSNVSAWPLVKRTPLMPVPTPSINIPRSTTASLLPAATTMPFVPLTRTEPNVPSQSSVIALVIVDCAKPAGIKAVNLTASGRFRDRSCECLAGSRSATRICIVPNAGNPSASCLGVGERTEH